MSDSQKINLQNWIDESHEKKERITSGKVLGIDYGEKNVGLALSDNTRSQAFAYDTISMNENIWINIGDIIEEEKVDKIIVGLPLSMKGEYTKKTEEVVYFIEMLENQIKIPVETEDERLSTVEGQKFSGGHDRDESAARVILQQYLDRSSNI